MIYRRTSLTSRAFISCILGGTALTVACGPAAIDGMPPYGSGGSTNVATAGLPGTGGTAAGGAGAVPGAGVGGTGTTAGAAAGAGGTTTATCNGTSVVMPKRLVRLTFDQQANAVATQLDPTLAESLKTEFDLPDAKQRTFPPLSNPREGSDITEATWQVGDNIAKAASDYVLQNFTTVTDCAAGDAACVLPFLQNFAAQAYRRPLTVEELASLQQIHDELVAAGSTAEELAKFGVYGIYSSPQFLYRSEFGDNAAVEGPLTAHEYGSLLSFFLTNAPPDAELLSTAANGSLLTPEVSSAQVNRLLATPAATANLEAAVFSYFTLAGLDTVVIDPLAAPEFNTGVRNAMYTEAEQFLTSTLWNGPLNNLLLSRQAFINQELANLYGLTAFPPSGATPDQFGFAWTELPETRSGILTQLGFLTSRARPDTGSVIARGLETIEKFLCLPRPAFPDALSDQVDEAEALLHDASEREKAEFRADKPVCAGCHASFDPYGLALENYNIIGKYRTADDQNRPIDASVTLPDGTPVLNAVELSQHLASSGVLSSCIAKNFFSFALAEGGPNLNDCAVREVVDRFNATDQSFASLIREIALSNTVVSRSTGAQ